MLRAGTQRIARKNLAVGVTYPAANRVEGITVSRLLAYPPCHRLRMRVHRVEAVPASKLTVASFIRQPVRACEQGRASHRVQRGCALNVSIWLLTHSGVDNCW